MNIQLPKQSIGKSNLVEPVCLVEAELADAAQQQFDELEAYKVSGRGLCNWTEQNDATQLYLNEIGFRDLLTAEQEKNYARQVQQGDTAARDIMIESNLRLVVKLARRYMNQGLRLLDLISEGNLGLIRAVEKFDPDLGYRFSTYATWWIRQSVERAIMNQGRSIRLPIHVKKELNVYLRAQRELLQKLSREPTLAELAEFMDKPIAKVHTMLGLNYRITSIDKQKSKDNEFSLVDIIADEGSHGPEQSMIHSNMLDNIGRWVDNLSGVQRDVICLRFGVFGHPSCTLEEVGEQVGLTRERVRQIQVQALKNLRGKLIANKLCKEDVMDSEI